MKKKVIVRAPLLTRSGYGFQARHALRALRAYEDYFDIYVVATKWGQCGWIYEDTEERRWIDHLISKTSEYRAQNNGGQFDIAIHVTIPMENEIEPLAPVNILYTSGVETTRISGQWITVCNKMDKILIISEAAKETFVKTAYEAKNQQTGEVIKDYHIVKPIEVVHYPVRKTEPVQVELGLKADFNFLACCQWGPRKNLDNTVRWFVEEFGDNPDVGLVVKTHLRGNSLMDREQVKTGLNGILADFPNRKCKIHLLHGDMTNEELSGLYNHPKIKAMVSISHGESWGLFLSEAAANGLPIVTIPWGGQCDFLFMPEKRKKTGKIKNKAMFAKVDFDVGPIQEQVVWEDVLIKDSSWAYPKAGSYKAKMRDVYKNYARFKNQAKKLASHLADKLNEEKKYEEFVEAVLGHSVKKISRDEVSDVAVITSVFNGKDHLQGYFQDLESQTYFDKMQIAMVHPKTSPGFEEEKTMIQAFIDEHPDSDILYKVLDEDPGVYGCWNEAVRMTDRDFVTNWNLDDRRSKNSIEAHAKFLHMNSDVSLVYSDSIVTHKPNETWESNTSESKYNMEQFSREAMMRFNLPHNCPIFRRDLFDKHGMFDENFFSAGDWDMWLRCAFAGEKFKKMDGVYNLYYFNPDGVSTNKETENKKQKEELSIYRKYQAMMLQEVVQEQNETDNH